MRKWLLLLGSFAFPLFAKQVALITGASRGVGLATAETFAKNGFTVYGTIRPSSQAPLAILNNLHFLKVDLLSEESIGAAIEEVLSREGQIDLLINNAGYALVGPIELLSREEMQEQMEINFFAPIRMVQAVLPVMRKQKSGRILNISSTNAVVTPPFGSLYAASKAALEALSESLAAEVAPYNIAVSIVEPGLLTTQFSIFTGTRDVLDHPYQDALEIIGSAIKGRADSFGTEPCQSAEEIAEVLFDIATRPEICLRYQTSEAAANEIKQHFLSRASDAAHIRQRREGPSDR